jgi:hypothetical protein
MSNHETHKGHDDPNETLPESSGINPRPILIFLGVLTAATILVFVLIKFLLYGFDRMDRATQGQPATYVGLPEGQRKLPPEPRLQGAPGPEGPSLLPLEDMKEYRERVDRRADSYGVDKQTGAPYIPIERAKELIAGRGLPVLKGPFIEEIKKAEEVRREVLNAEPSGGRIIK